MTSATVQPIMGSQSEENKSSQEATFLRAKLKDVSALLNEAQAKGISYQYCAG